MARTAQEILDQVEEALFQAPGTGKSFTIEGNVYTQHDLDALWALRAKLKAEIADADISHPRRSFAAFRTTS